MLEAVNDKRVWKHIKLLYLGSGLLLGANITVGIVNVFTDGTIPHAQILTHFHAGTIGWVTLSVIATSLWLFTGRREVSDGYAGFTGGLAAVGFLAVLGYIFAFALAFSSTDRWYLLPTFGVPTALVIVTSFIFVAAQLKKQAIVTTPHLLLFGALLVASLGATMGVIWGMTYANDGFNPYPENDAADGLGAHAGPMDMYIALALAALIEGALRTDATRWSKPGLFQMLAGVLGGFAVSTGLFLGIEPLAPVALLLFLIGFGFYFVRIGWRAIAQNPFRRGSAPGLFFAGLSFPLYVAGFVLLVFKYFIPGEDPPHDLVVAFQHVTFIGLATNTILVTQARFAPHPGTDGVFAAGVWTMNVGLIAFIAGEFLADEKMGALLQALGLILALFTVWHRLLHAEHGAAPPAPPVRPVEPAPFEPKMVE